MTYDTPEASVSDGRPYFLYLFDNGITRVTLTSNAYDLDREVDVGEGVETFVASPVAHGDLEQSGNIEKNDVELTFPLSDTFARTQLGVVNEITTFTIWRGHHSDLTNELRVFWKGRVTGATSSKQAITVSVESIFTSMRRSGCRARYQRTCRHALYFPGCNLDIEDFQVAGTVTDVSGLELTVTEAASQPDGYYKAGVVVFNGLFGWVQSHVGDTLTLLGAIPEGLADTVDNDGFANVFIAPGCDLSLATCTDKFANNLNFGGFPNMSDDNPFSKSIV